MGTFFAEEKLGLVNSRSGLVGRGVTLFTGSGVRVSGAGGLCEGVGVDVMVERIEAAVGLGTGCLGGGILGFVGGAT